MHSLHASQSAIIVVAPNYKRNTSSEEALEKVSWHAKTAELQ